jgi:hypothetical protein
MLSCMAGEVRLEGGDAGHIGELLYGLSNLLDPEMGPTYSKFKLSEQQILLLTGGSAVAQHPEELAKVLRHYVAEIYGQLGDDAPEL